MKKTAVEWFFSELERMQYFIGNDMLEAYKKAKQMEKEQKGYSEEDVREMLFMALHEPQTECCTTHTKDSIVRKVLKTFKSE